MAAKTKKTVAKKPAKSKSAAKAPALIPSASEDVKHLEEVGSHVVPSRLLDGASKRLGFAEQDEAVLAPFSFSAAWRAAMEPKVQELSDGVAVRGVDEGAVHPSAEQSSAAMKQGEELLRRFGVMVTVAPRALVTDAPHVRRPHSPAEMSATLGIVAKYVDGHEKTLAGYGLSSGFGDQLRAVAKSLQAARDDHAKARAKLSPEVREIWQTAGVVYLELVRLSHAAHGLLPPERSKLYALDELHPNLRGAHAPPPPPAEALKSK